MVKLQENAEHGKPTLNAAIGKGPAHETRYGRSIDVVRTDNGERVWGDLVPTNQEIIDDLVAGVCIEVSHVEVIHCGYRPIWRGRVTIISP